MSNYYLYSNLVNHNIIGNDQQKFIFIDCDIKNIDSLEFIKNNITVSIFQVHTINSTEFPQSLKSHDATDINLLVTEHTLVSNAVSLQLKQISKIKNLTVTYLNNNDFFDYIINNLKSNKKFNFSFDLIRDKKQFIYNIYTPYLLPIKEPILSKKNSGFFKLNTTNQKNSLFKKPKLNIETHTTQIIELEKIINEQKIKLKIKENQLIDTQKRLNAYIMQLTEVGNIVYEYKEDLDFYQKRIQQLESSLTQISTSKFWLITKPLRYFFNFMVFLIIHINKKINIYGITKKIVKRYMPAKIKEKIRIKYIKNKKIKK